ncbi:superinfection immunity protein [Pseudomonas proteolytica]|nr:superinfection immunity protein [Pseudomonas proteolytica]USW94206.1 superinfection immunity protein [Pseudomonas proteolytica]USX01824.1 superinfection immunity protein [Pseudomonas proteolytica]
MKIFGLGILIPLCALSYLCRNGGNDVALAANILFYSSALMLYFYPSICAIRCAKQDRTSVIWLNLFFGWTGIGWLLVLYRALVIGAEEE